MPIKIQASRRSNRVAPGRPPANVRDGLEQAVCTLAAEAPYQDVLHLVSRLLFLLRAEAEHILPQDAARAVEGWRKRAVLRRRASSYDVASEVRDVLRECRIEEPAAVS